MITGIVFADAAADFARAQRRRTWSRLVRRLHLRPDHGSELLAFDEVIGKLGQTGQRQLGLYELDIDTIIGSVDRVGDFDRWFRPRPRVDRQRWIDLDRAEKAGANIPPIEVYRIGHMHFVNDGHHRVSIARAHDQRAIEAFVTEVTTTLPATPDRLDKPEHKTGQQSRSLDRWLRKGGWDRWRPTMPSTASFLGGHGGCAGCSPTAPGAGSYPDSGSRRRRVSHRRDRWLPTRRSTRLPRPRPTTGPSWR